MPFAFGGADLERRACLNSAALFDFSFILRMLVSGQEANEAVSAFCGRNISDLPEGAIRYALHVDVNGYLLSDLTVWRVGPQEIEVMSGRAEDFDDLRIAIAPFNAQVFDLSANTAVFAVQGPDTNKILTEMGFDIDIEKIPYFRFRDIRLMNQAYRVGRLGFTGLPGVEILCPLKRAPSLWERLSVKVTPAGMLAADRIRLSAGFALFTQEFLPKVTAADAGLSRFRPSGDTAGDRRPAKVCRVIFSGSMNGDLDPVHWSEKQDFPPKPNILAVTSVVKSFSPREVLGMGYIGVKSLGSEYNEPSAILKNISIIQRFGNDGD